MTRWGRRSSGHGRRALGVLLIPALVLPGAVVFAASEWLLGLSVWWAVPIVIYAVIVIVAVRLFWPTDKGGVAGSGGRLPSRDERRRGSESARSEAER